jgi:hypothetical protein
MTQPAGHAVPTGGSTRSGNLRRLVVAPDLAHSLLFWAGAVLVALSALIHLHLWSTGYRHIPTIGPLFLLQGIAGLAVAVAVAVTRHPWVAAAGALFVAGTLGGLVLSVEVGLFGFTDSFHAPYAVTSLMVEAAAFVVLVAAALTSRRSASPTRTA